MTASHTPGPWLWLGTEGTIAMIVDEDGYSIARVEALENSTAHHALQANLRLMTAAPDLLDALQAIMAGVAGCQREPQWEAARAAIKRATGGN